MVHVAKDVVLGKVGWEGSETLAIARFDPLKGYIEEENRLMDKLC